MGLGSNHVVSPEEEFATDAMVDDFGEKAVSSGSDCGDNNSLPISPISKQRSPPPVLRFRNRTMSRSERTFKGKSSELVKKALYSESKRRPTSQFYVSHETSSSPDGSRDSPPNLVRLATVSAGSQPVLSSIEKTSNQSSNEPSGLLSRYLALRTSTPHLTAVDGFLQRFRKSFAFRFQKKKSESPSHLSAKDVVVLKSMPDLNDSKPEVNSLINTPDKRQPLAPKHEHKEKEEEKIKKEGISVNSENFHNLVLRTIRERKATRRRNDHRMSLFCDGITNRNGNKLGFAHYPSGSEAHLLRKGTAHPSDCSPKSKVLQRPLSVLDNSDSVFKVSDDRQNLLERVSSNSTADYDRKTVNLDQTLQENQNQLKLCRAHSKIVTCPHRGKYQLRRSISHPVELESLGSVKNLHESLHGLNEADGYQKGSSDDDDAASSDSEVYHSFGCSPTKRSNTCWELSSEGGIFAEALWDHETSDSEELPFQAGDLIEVTDTSDREWWWGTKTGRGGWFPAAFVRVYISHNGPPNNFAGQPSNNVQSPCSPSKGINLSFEQVRANIVQEIVVTERDYVKHLKDVVEGYLKQVFRRPDMFSKETIQTVFGNIKDIYQFQSQFLIQLENCLAKELHLSQIGNSFLENKEKFKMYSEYCNNHPLAVSELQELYCDSQYVHFFEACRLLQEMIDISLDGFLLTPIQRICKYPLQLAELLKFTDISHPDHTPVTKALAAMKEVAELVNERKRRMECLERLAEWQNTIEGWEGADVLDTSSILIHCGEVTRVTSSWSRDVYIFIFDHLLVYCKKDLLKRQTYAYKGRLNLDSCDIVDVEDGKDSQFALTVKNGWKLYCKEKDKWFLFYAKTAPEKDQWLAAFKAERKRVADDKEQGFVVTEDARKAARLAVQNKHKPKKPRAKFSKGRRCHPDVAVTELLLDPPSAKARTGSLPSNIHPELAIMAGAKMGPPRKKGSGWFHFGSGKKPKS